MSIYDFVTHEEIEAAPDDDTAAFLYMVRMGEQRLAQRTLNEEEYQAVKVERLNFQTFVLAIAKSYEIDRFSDFSYVGTDRKDDKNLDYFFEELDSYVAQMAILNSKREKRAAIEMALPLKERIRTHLHHMKVEIDKMSISDSHKAALHKKIREFEELLEKHRVNMWALARVLLEIMSVSANGLQIYESSTVKGLVSNIFATVAEAKSVDDQQRRLPPIEPPPVALPIHQQPTRRETFSADLDDEIPF